MAVHANLAFHRAGSPVPVATSAAMGSSFPVAIGRPVATAAERGAFRQFDLTPIAGLQQFQVLLVVAVEAVVVAVMRPVPHHNILMLFRDDEVVLRIEPYLRRPMVWREFEYEPPVPEAKPKPKGDGAA